MRASHFCLVAIHLLVGRNAAHDAPHARIEHGVGADIVVPHALARAFERKVPAALRIGQRLLGLLLQLDIGDLHDEIVRLPAPSRRAAPRPRPSPRAGCHRRGGSDARRDIRSASPRISRCQAQPRRGAVLVMDEVENAERRRRRRRHGPACREGAVGIDQSARPCRHTTMPTAALSTILASIEPIRSKRTSRRSSDFVVRAGISPVCVDSPLISGLGTATHRAM